MHSLTRVLVLAAAVTGSGACVAELDDSAADPSAADDSAPHADSERARASRVVHKQYVAERIGFGASSQENRRDIDGDGDVENKLGAIFAQMSSTDSLFSLQGALERGVDRGQSILLLDLQRPTIGSGAAIVRSFGGANPDPAPCASSSDPVCRGHLAGDGHFDIAPKSAGSVSGSYDAVTARFTGSGGGVILDLPFVGLPLRLPLSAAQIDLRLSSDGSAWTVIAGAISNLTVQDVVIPHFHQWVSAVVAADCHGGSSPGCGCDSGSGGATVIGLLDTTADCSVSLDEVRESAFTRTLMTPDLDLAPIDGINDSMSVGVGVSAVPASFSL